jgi:hypothetical protein
LFFEALGRVYARWSKRTLAAVRVLAHMLNGKKKSRKESTFIKKQTLPEFSDLSSNL